jgi:hypothetical protein
MVQQESGGTSEGATRRREGRPLFFLFDMRLGIAGRQLLEASVTCLMRLEYGMNIRTIQSPYLCSVLVATKHKRKICSWGGRHG